MKIVVLGASGGTGGQVVEQAVAAGHDVTAVLRRPAAVDLPGARVVPGDVLDAATLDGAFGKADAVISALGVHTGRAPTEVYSRGTRNVRAAMVAAGVRRLVAVSAVPVSLPAEKTVTDRIIHAVLYRFFGGGYHDQRRMETDLRTADDVDWTIFRPPRLLDGPATGTYRTAVDARLPRAAAIRRADLATALLAALDDPALVGKVVLIAR